MKEIILTSSRYDVMTSIDKVSKNWSNMIHEEPIHRYRISKAPPRVERLQETMSTVDACTIICASRREYTTGRGYCVYRSVPSRMGSMSVDACVVADFRTVLFLLSSMYVES